MLTISNISNHFIAQSAPISMPLRTWKACEHFPTSSGLAHAISAFPHMFWSMFKSTFLPITPLISPIHSPHHEGLTHGPTYPRRTRASSWPQFPEYTLKSAQKSGTRGAIIYLPSQRHINMSDSGMESFGSKNMGMWGNSHMRWGVALFEIRGWDHVAWGVGLNGGAIE